MTSVAALLARSELLAGHRPSGPDTPVTPSHPHEHAGRSRRRDVLGHRTRVLIAVMRPVAVVSSAGTVGSNSPIEMDGLRHRWLRGPVSFRASSRCAS
jgi:hypothetical protein